MSRPEGTLSRLCDGYVRAHARLPERVARGSGLDHRSPSAETGRDEPVDDGGTRQQVKRSSNLHQNQTTSVDELFRGRPPLRPLARELLRFAREVAWPPRLAKITATDREGSIAGRIAVRSPWTLM